MREDPWLWHARYDHLNFQALRKLANTNIVVGLPHLKHFDQVCDGCLMGKQRCIPFPHETTFRGEKPLMLVHGDLCGPITPSTPVGNRYFLLLVDDYSRYMWIILLRTKDEALKAFMRVKASAEMEVDLKIKALHTDRGGEFTSNEFKAIVKMPASNASSLLPAHRIRMGWWRGETKLSWAWQEASSRARGCRACFGEKQ